MGTSKLSTDPAVFSRTVLKVHKVEENRLDYLADMTNRCVRVFGMQGQLHALHVEYPKHLLVENRLEVIQPIFLDFCVHINTLYGSN